MRWRPLGVAALCGLAGLAAADWDHTRYALVDQSTMIVCDGSAQFVLRNGPSWTVDDGSFSKWAVSEGQTDAGGVAKTLLADAKRSLPIAEVRVGKGGELSYRVPTDKPLQWLTIPRSEPDAIGVFAKKLGVSETSLLAKLSGGAAGRSSMLEAIADRASGKPPQFEVLLKASVPTSIVLISASVSAPAASAAPVSRAKPVLPSRDRGISEVVWAGLAGIGVVLLAIGWAGGRFIGTTRLRRALLANEGMRQTLTRLESEVAEMVRGGKWTVADAVDSRAKEFGGREAKAEKASAEVGRLSKELEKLKAEVNRLERYRDFSERYEVYEKAFTQERANRQKAQDEAEPLRKEVASLRSEVKVTNNKVMQLDQLMADCADDLINLAALSRSVKDTLAHIEGDVESL